MRIYINLEKTSSTCYSMTTETQASIINKTLKEKYAWNANTQNSGGGGDFMTGRSSVALGAMGSGAGLMNPGNGRQRSSQEAQN